MSYLSYQTCLANKYNTDMMACKCGAHTKVIDSRPSHGGRGIRRRRVCPRCKRKTRTLELITLYTPDEFLTETKTWTCTQCQRTFDTLDEAHWHECIRVCK